MYREYYVVIYCLTELLIETLSVQWTDDTWPVLADNMGVDHCRRLVRMRQ
jgi:hypothetical protein